MRVLVIEDNPKMSVVLQRGLQEHGFSVDCALTGAEGEDMAALEPYDAIVLDLMLPDRDGIEVCRNLRRRKVTTPIMMLTALSATDDKVTGLDAGADDYVTKPFEFEELIARLRALLRRGTQVGSAVLRCDDMEMDLAGRRVKRGGQVISLTHKEFALLEYFMRNPDRVLSREAIASHVWDINFNPLSNVVDVYVSTLRKKVDKPFGRPLIHTAIGAGYRFGPGEESSPES